MIGLRAMGTNGVQEPATGFENGKLIGTKRLFADGKFSTKDGKATFMATQWRGLAGARQRGGIEEIRVPHQQWPRQPGLAERLSRPAERLRHGPLALPVHPDEPGGHEGGRALSAGDLVEVYNDNGATQAMAYPTPTAKRKQTFMLFAFPTGVQGNVVSPGVNELIIPNYKQTWGNIRKIASAPGAARGTSFKSWEFKV